MRSERRAGIVLSVAAVVLAWALVTRVFALKYARLYYFDIDGPASWPSRST